IYSHEDPVDNQMRKAVEESDPKGELRDIAWSRCFVQRSEGRHRKVSGTIIEFADATRHSALGIMRRVMKNHGSARNRDAMRHFVP
ncbi:MAG: hypothetical protein KBT08_02530, partial [Bacteroidales bacterium]|nr:hypothetical protein [Candidatus Cryptobacteroides onthequi]